MTGPIWQHWFIQHTGRIKIIIYSVNTATQRFILLTWLSICLVCNNYDNNSYYNWLVLLMTQIRCNWLMTACARMSVLLRIRVAYSAQFKDKFRTRISGYSWYENQLYLGNWYSWFYQWLYPTGHSQFCYQLFPKKIMYWIQLIFLPAVSWNSNSRSKLVLELSRTGSTCIKEWFQHFFVRLMMRVILYSIDKANLHAKFCESLTSNFKNVSVLTCWFSIFILLTSLYCVFPDTFLSLCF